MDVANDLSGAVLDGRYKVIEPVAEGAMGVVYRAERLKLGRIVAIKVLHDELPDELSSRKRFEIEAMAMSRLDHPHCAAVLDVGAHDGRPFVVMDFVQGDDLRKVIADGPVGLPRAVEIMRQVLSGLAHAHELGIIHRDIKPANMILSQKAGLGDHVKILDFGLARLQQEQTTRLTTGIVVGTPAYMAPEQIRGQQIDGRADLYACGVLLTELITGRKPFHSAKDDPIEMVSKHLKDAPPTLAQLMPGKDFGELEAVVAKALAKSADDRFQSATEFVAALEAAYRRSHVLAPTEPAGSTMTDAQAQQISESMMIPQGGTQLGLAAHPPTQAPAHASRAPRAGLPTPLGVPSPPPAVQGHGTTPAAPVSAPSAAAQPSRPGPAQAWPGSAPVPARRGLDGLPFTNKQLAIAGGGLLLLIVIIAAVASGGGGATGARAAGSGADGTSEIEMEPTGDDGARKVIDRAKDLISNREYEAAIKVLTNARSTFPDNAELPYLAGKLYMGKMWWSEGIRQFRAAVKLDPSYREDPELIKLVLKGFNTTPSYNDELADFLRETVGEPARAYLEETASSHPNPNIRSRARSELDRFR